MPVNVRSSQLNSTVQAYAGLGWSVIPTQGKVAAVRWTEYQQRRATASELAAWFSDPAITAAAVVTGPVSRLLIMDFDNPDLFMAFARQQTQLIDTLTVRTRRGFHLYFHVPDQMDIRSRRLQGIDLLYTGRYAILPGSTVEGHTYHITLARPAKTLTPSGWKAINDFLDAQGTGIPETAQNAAKRLIRPNSATSQQPSSRLETLLHLYRRHLGQGRNNALFRTACYARDQGWGESGVMQALGDVHAAQPAVGCHRIETFRARQAEAALTIRSAFSRPARPARDWEHVPQLPNNLRERLMQAGEYGVIRVLEGLRLKGIEPGTGFSADQALILLQGIVGRDTVRSALKHPIFSPPAPPKYLVAVSSDQGVNQKCFLFGMTKSGKSRYHLPDNAQVARILGIKALKGSDPLTLDDLGSARLLREALHRALIRRRPGEYRLRWLAGRLRVSSRTICRYHAADPGYRREIVCDATEITWFNIDSAIPDITPHGGFFLMNKHLKKYPCKLAIARKLLARKQRVWLMRQRPNYWSYVEEEEINPFQPRPAVRTVNPPAAVSRAEPVRMAGMRVNLTIDPSRAAYMAQTLRDRLNDPGFSLVSARRMVEKYGEKAIWRALAIVQSRHNVRKPVGLLATILRSERMANSFLG